MSNEWISASHLGQWSYCNRQWFLAHVVGLRPDRAGRRRMEEGTAVHRRYGERIERARTLRRLSALLLLLAALAAAWVLLAGAAYDEAAAREAVRFVSRYPLLAVGAALAGALLLRIAALRAHRETGLPEGARVLFGDSGRQKVKLLRDPKTGLSGKPDSILGVSGLFRTRYVAAELKSVRGSTRVHDGHRLQVLAYVLLLRAAYGSRAARYGYVLLTGGSDAAGRLHIRLAEKVTLDRGNRAWLLATAREIRRAREARDVSRSHESPAKCVSCAFRGQCDESLA